MVTTVQNQAQVGTSFPFIRKVVELNFPQFRTAGLTQTVNVLALPADCHVLGLQMEVITAFAGTTTCTLSLGVVGTPQGFIVAEDAKTTGIKNATIGALYVLGKMVYTTSTQIVTRAVATVDNLSNLTAGRVRYIIIYADNT